MGIFAKEKIFKDEIIEIAPLVKLNVSLDSDFLFHYRFYYPKNGKVDGYVVALGYGSLYNHSKDNNAYWRDGKPLTFEIFATRDIEPDEEICINYGGPAYFNARPNNWLP